MGILTKESNDATISNSQVNLKIDDFEIIKEVDTIILSIYIGNKSNAYSLSDLLNSEFYGYSVDKVIEHSNKYSVFKVVADNAKIEVKGINAYGFLTMKISSLDKLVIDLGINIRNEEKLFANDIKEKVIKPLFSCKMPGNDIRVKKCDLALDVYFPHIKEEFKHFCKQLTSVILNMDFPYLKAEKKSYWLTGYLKSMRANNKIMRIYNKEIHEKDRHGEDEIYDSTFRIEYLFKESHLKYMGGNKLFNIDINRGFKRIKDVCKKASSRYEEKIEEYHSENLSREGDRMYSEYAHNFLNEDIFSETWECGVDLSKMFKGRKPIFHDESNSSYYKKRTTRKYSYISLVLEREKKYYYDLFNKIISSI